MQSERDFQNNLNDRRSFIKLLAATPLFAAIGTRSFASAVAATQPESRRSPGPPQAPRLEPKLRPSL
jgi:hypothetical protein